MKSLIKVTTVTQCMAVIKTTEEIRLVTLLILFLDDTRILYTDHCHITLTLTMVAMAC